MIVSDCTIVWTVHNVQTADTPGAWVILIR